MNTLIGQIYVLKFPNGKRYVGQTTGTIDVRVKRHWYDANSGCPYLVHKAMRKFGKDAFEIEDCLSIYGGQKDLDTAEDRYIAYYDTMAPRGYNLQQGGRGGKPGQIVRAKLSAARQGKRHSSETKAKISAAMKGKSKSKTHKAKISKANRGRTMPVRSDEHKARLSAANKGKVKPPRSEEHKANIAAALKDHPGHWKGKSHSDETRTKMSISQKKRWSKIKKENING